MKNFKVALVFFVLAFGITLVMAFMVFPSKINHNGPNNLSVANTNAVQDLYLIIDDGEVDRIFLSKNDATSYVVKSSTPLTSYRVKVSSTKSFSYEDKINLIK